MKETFELLWEYCTSNNKICPMPIKWNELYQLLENTQQIGVGYEPPIPLILGAWHNTSDYQKQNRLKVHIEWAKEHNQLDDIGSYLRSLKKEEWLHSKEV